MSITYRHLLKVSSVYHSPEDDRNRKRRTQREDLSITARGLLSALIGGSIGTAGGLALRGRMGYKTPFSPNYNSGVEMLKNTTPVAGAFLGALGGTSLSALRTVLRRKHLGLAPYDEESVLADPNKSYQLQRHAYNIAKPAVWGTLGGAGLGYLAGKVLPDRIVTPGGGAAAAGLLGGAAGLGRGIYTSVDSFRENRDPVTKQDLYEVNDRKQLRALHEQLRQMPQFQSP
jgi:hypothetical protein